MLTEGSRQFPLHHGCCAPVVSTEWATGPTCWRTRLNRPGPSLWLPASTERAQPTVQWPLAVSYQPFLLTKQGGHCCVTQRQSNCCHGASAEVRGAIEMHDKRFPCIITLIKTAIKLTKLPCLNITPTSTCNI